MLKKATLLHLRIPFSLYLLPFFCFALSQAPVHNLINTILSGIIIHLLFYPASNGFNSYFDKDEESIGGLKNPPKVDKELYYVSLGFDVLAFVLSLLISLDFAIMLLIIGFASKAYSHPSIRLKKYPIIGLLTVSFFQGAFTYAMSMMAIAAMNFAEVLSKTILEPASLCALLLLGSYPMTQIYQHGEDGRRGDRTISRMLGIKGTFIWTGAVFFVAIIGFYFYFSALYNSAIFLVLMFCLLPVLFFFAKWFLQVLQDESKADFESTMLLNKLSSLGFICFFLFLTLYNHGLFHSLNF